MSAPALPALLAASPRTFLEIGSGKGEFLCDLARADPDVLCVGIEMRRGRVERIARRIASGGLSNARIVAGDARAILSGWIPTGSVDALFMNFPDPWPKSRHAARRLAGGRDRHEAARVLKPGGTLTYATDVAGRIREAVEAFAAEGWGVAEPSGGRPEGYPASVHERKFRAWGRAIHFRVFARPVR